MIDEMSWYQFSSLPGMNQLPLHEIERKYRIYINEVTEQRIALNMLQERISQAEAMAVAASNGGGSLIQQEEGEIPAGCIQFVVNTFESTYFEFSVRSNTNEFTYTVNWGDGETGEGSSGEGYVGLDHTYPDGVADYTVRVCFSDASIIHDINFPGFD